MHSRSVVSAAVVGALLAVLAPQRAHSRTDDDANRWIAEHAIRVRTIEPGANDFSDLAPLKAVIGDARVVMLGEQTHGDGATFLAKTRLIEFLHAEMGFDVLVFEAGLYDCEHAWQSLKGGTDAWSAMSTGIFQIWMWSRQLTGLTDFMDRARTTERPMELAGYDAQLTGSSSYNHLYDDIVRLNSEGNPPALDDAGIAAVKAYLDALFKSTPLEAAANNAGEAALAALQTGLDSDRYRVVPSRDRAFWKQMLKSLPAFARMISASARKDAGSNEAFNARDIQGGDTMIWLARERYPDRKLVVWAASMHCIRETDRLQPFDERFHSVGLKTMGHVASAALGDDVFFIAFTTGPGVAGSVLHGSYPVPEPMADSLEARCAAVQVGNCIVPLRGAAEGTFGASEFIARPLGNVSMKATWRNHVDAFFYTPTMFPCTRRPTVEQIAKFKDLTSTLEGEAKAKSARCTAKHVFADKGDFSSVWDEWIAVMQPTEHVMRETAVSIDAWAQPLRADPCIGWRVLALQAHIAQGFGETAKAIELLDAAMVAYPSTVYAEPAQQSGYHHLANARALLLLKTEDFNEVLEWIADRITNDDRMRAFFAGPWLEALHENRGQRVRLRFVVGEAFAARAKRLPQDAAAIEAVAKMTDEMFDSQ